MKPLNEINHISFSYNWNNKLDCLSFTTIRINNPKKYQIGSKYIIKLKSQCKPKLAEILEVKTLLLSDINEWIARIDTGYNKQEFDNLIKTMYKNQGINWNTQKLDFILLAYTNESVTEKIDLFA